ncbi:MAG: endonuclease VII domain-containing protein [Actinoallomurus sp.]
MAERGKQVRERPEVPEGFKCCPQCEEVQPISAFGRNRANTDGMASYCRPCHNRVMADNKAKNHGSTRSYFLKLRYGLSEEDVAETVQRQARRCLICLHIRPLHVDHDHSTGEVRGLLCFRCNGALGQFKDDPTTMRRAVDYLERAPIQQRRPAEARPRTRGDRKSARHYHLVRRYRIGEREVERLIELQGGLCLICGEAPPTAVDHDHVTWAVRGILCGDCNTGMGQLGDNSWMLRRAIEYLTGGLSGLRRTDDGGFEVTVVRPRKAPPATDPGWDVGNIGGHDLTILHALAFGDSGDPWESDIGVAEPGPVEPRFPVLDLSDPLDDAPLPAGPLDPVEYAVS